MWIANVERIDSCYQNDLGSWYDDVLHGWLWVDCAVFKGNWMMRYSCERNLVALAVQRIGVDVCSCVEPFCCCYCVVRGVGCCGRLRMNCWGAASYGSCLNALWINQLRALRLLIPKLVRWQRGLHSPCAATSTPFITAYILCLFHRFYYFSLHWLLNFLVWLLSWYCHWTFTIYKSSLSFYLDYHLIYAVIDFGGETLAERFCFWPLCHIDERLLCEDFR